MKTGMLDLLFVCLAVAAGHTAAKRILLAPSSDCATTSASLQNDCSTILPKVQSNRDLISANDAQLQAFARTLNTPPTCCTTLQKWAKDGCRCDPTTVSLSKTAYNISPKGLEVTSKTGAYSCNYPLSTDTGTC